MRWVVLKIGNFKVGYKMRYIYCSCIIFLILYSITNEPVYYSSMFWSITIWLFLNPEKGRSNGETIDEMEVGNHE